MINGPIVIDKFEDACTEDDYRKISKNFKVTNNLYCAITVNIYDYISNCDSGKEIWETLNHIYGIN